MTDVAIDWRTLDWDQSERWPLVCETEVEGLRIVIGQEEDSQFADPRDCANLGTMVCWHPDYILGDEQIAGDRDAGTSGAIRRDRNGSASTLFQTETGRTDFRSMEVIERYLHLARGAVVTIPLYLYDHSGISMSAGAPNPFDNPRVRSDHHGNGLGWDTTMVGYIYTTRERIAELCGEPQLDSDPFYCPRTWPADGRSGPNWPRERTATEWIVKQLQQEVELYDEWLRGEVYWYRIDNDEGDCIGGCGGFLGGGIDADGKEIDAIDYAKQEACDEAEGIIAGMRRDAEVERIERERCATIGIPTVES